MINHKYLGRNSSEIYLCSYVVDENNPNVLTVPPLGWYSVGPNRIFSRLAGILNEIGINVYTFDYLGQGESKKSCKTISMDDLKYSFNMAIEYIKCLNKDIYCLGYGLGNHFIMNMVGDDQVKGVILYTPDYEKSYTYKEVFDEKEIEAAGERGYFLVERDKTMKQVFWKSIIGGFQDVIYNPISYDVVTHFHNATIKEWLKEYKKSALIISDSELVETYENIDIYYSKELERYILPSEWEVNIWPFVLDNINDIVANWIQKQIEDRKTNYSECLNLDKIEPVYTYSEMESDNGSRRILTSYKSYGQKNLGVLHLPKDLSLKMPCVIFVTGLGGDKLESHMCGPRLGEYFAANGFAFFRYDSRFSGTSPKCLSWCTISTLREDFNEVKKFLDSYSNIIDTKKYIIIGWSEGAKIAIAEKEKNESIIGSCLWNAVLIENEGDNEKVDLQTSLRSYVRHKKTNRKVKSIHNAGELIGFDYVLDNKKLNYLELLEKTEQPIKLIWSKEEIKTTNYKCLKKFNLDETIVDANHHLFNYEIMDYIYDVTYEWAKEILS